MPGHSYSHTNTQQNSIETGACEQSAANNYAGVGNAELAGQLLEFQSADDMAHDGWGSAMAESAEELLLEELVGDDFAAGLDFVVDGFLGASLSLTQLLPDITTADPAMGQTLDALFKGGDEVFGDVDFLIEELRASATFEGDEVVVDQSLLAELDEVLSLIEEYTDVIELAVERWSFVLGLPDLQQLQTTMLLVAGVNALMIKRGEGLIAELTSLQEQLKLHERELSEAFLKVGADFILFGAGVGLAAAAPAAPVALGVGVGVALSGIAASLLIEGSLSNFGKLKATISGTTLTTSATGMLKKFPAATSGLKALGPALNLISLALDTMEASEERTAIADIKARMEGLQPDVDTFLTELPQLESGLSAMLSSFAHLQEELSTWADRVDVIDQELAASLPQFAG